MNITPNSVKSSLTDRLSRSQWKEGLKRRRPNGSKTKSAGGDGLASACSHASSPSSRTPGSQMELSLQGSEDRANSNGTEVAQSIFTLSSLPTPLTLPGYIAPLPESTDRDEGEYLVAIGALRIPETHLRDSLLQAFIEYVYPSLPVVDLEELLIILQDKHGGNGQVSLLVFQAIMFAGSAFVDLNCLRAAGFENRKTARRILFRKVKVLYELDVESSYTHLIQALLLMTYALEELEERKDIWYWMSIVVTLSHACGLHHSPEMIDGSVAENLLNRRLWWCVFIQNQLSD